VDVKIAIVGGGSAYAPGLLQAFAAEASAFAGAELALMDVAAPELEVVHRLGRRLLEGTGLRLSATTDRLRALEGADFVLTTFREGGLPARHLDESVPLEFGVIGQETIGPGGFFFAMRTLRVMRAIADELAAWAPAAVVVNYANPTQIVAEAMSRHTSVRCVAICDQTDDDRVHLAAALGVAPADVELESVGLNHATWSTACLVEGEDGVGRIAAASASLQARAEIAPRVKRQFLLTREFGRVPNGYLPYYYDRRATVAEARAAGRTRAQVIAAELPAMYRHFDEQSRADVPRLTHGRGGSVFGDFAVKVLRALATGAPARLTLNVRNDGALPDLDPERIVEVPCEVAGGRATPLPQPRFSRDTVGLLRMLADYQAAAADAIWADDPGAIARALAANPLVVSLSLARDLLRARATAGA
jgi:6-phospho-beta-glucosidase